MDLGAGQNLPPTHITPERPFGVDPIAARTIQQSQIEANGLTDFEHLKIRVTKLVLAIQSDEATDDEVEELDYLTRESQAVAEFVRRLMHQHLRCIDAGRPVCEKADEAEVTMNRIGSR